MLFVLNIFIFHLVPPCVHTSNQHGVTCSSEVELKVKTFNCQVAMGTLFCITPDWLTNGILVMESITACSHFYSTLTTKAWLPPVKFTLSLLVPSGISLGLEELVADCSTSAFPPPSEPFSCAGTMSGPSVCGVGLTWKSRLIVSWQNSVLLAEKVVVPGYLICSFTWAQVYMDTQALVVGLCGTGGIIG